MRGAWTGCVIRDPPQRKAPGWYARGTRPLFGANIWRVIWVWSLGMEVSKKPQNLALKRAILLGFS